MGINLIGQRDSILTSEGEQRVFDPISQPQTATGEYLPLCRRTGGDISILSYADATALHS